MIASSVVSDGLRSKLRGIRLRHKRSTCAGKWRTIGRSSWTNCYTGTPVGLIIYYTGTLVGPIASKGKGP